MRASSGRRPLFLLAAACASLTTVGTARAQEAKPGGVWVRWEVVALRDGAVDWQPTEVGRKLQQEKLVVTDARGSDRTNLAALIALGRATVLDSRIVRPGADRIPLVRREAQGPHLTGTIKPQVAEGQVSADLDFTYGPSMLKRRVAVPPDGRVLMLLPGEEGKEQTRLVIVTFTRPQ